MAFGKKKKVVKKEVPVKKEEEFTLSDYELSLVANFLNQSEEVNLFRKVVEGESLSLIVQKITSHIEENSDEEEDEDEDESDLEDLED